MNKYRTIVKKLLDKENIKSLDEKEIAMLKKDKVIEEWNYNKWRLGEKDSS